VSRSYGRLYCDPQSKDLFHVPCCTAGQALVFDFEHSSSGAYSGSFAAITLQIAFQYAQVVAASRHSSASSSSASSQPPPPPPQQQQQQQNGLQRDGSSGGGAAAYVVQRRLRVCTIR
jgi:hypothetical protein